jgi:ADP-heptose:LPS heptosyltransferase
MKRWPYWQELIYKLPGCAVVGLEGDGGELNGDFEDYRGKLTLAQVAGLFSNAKTVIAEESGMSHLSCAQGAKTLILFGGTDPLKNLPPNNGIIIKTKEELACQPCQLKGTLHRVGRGLNVIYHGCRPNEKIDGYSRCMHSLSLEDVLEVL